MSLRGKLETSKTQNMFDIFRNEKTDYILGKALAGERISPLEALDLYNDTDFLKVIATAREIRNRKHDPSVVTYTMFRIVNYTTVCNVNCSFCSFHEPPGSPVGKVLSIRDVEQKMREAGASRA